MKKKTIKKEIIVTKTETSTEKKNGLFITTTKFFTKKGRKWINTGNYYSFLWPDKPQNKWKKIKKKKPRLN